MKQLNEILDIKYPIIMAPMFLVTNTKMMIEALNSNIAACIPALNFRTIEELEHALDDGISFDGSAIEGFARNDESDMLIVPDPSTFQVLPWRPKEQAVARMFCDIQIPGGESFVGDPRNVLKRTLSSAAKTGFSFYISPEIEFFYFKNSETCHSNP